MKKILQTALVVALCGVTLQLSAAESAEIVLKKYVDAIGGDAAFRKAKTRIMSGVLDIPAQGLSANMKIISKAPNKTRTEIDIPNMGKVVEACDGTKAWAQSPFTGTMEKEGEQLEQAKRQADFYRDVELMKRFASWKVAAPQKVGGKDAIVLIGTPSSGEPETHFFDAETYLLLKVSSSMPTPNGNMDAATILSDYREVGGVKTPHSIKIESPMGSVSMQIKEVKYNVDAPDSLFAMPSK